MIETEARAIITLLAFIIKRQDIPRQIIDKSTQDQYRFHGSNDDLDDVNFTVSSSQLGTINIQVSGNSYQAEVQSSRVHVTARGIEVSQAEDEENGQRYNQFTISSSEVRFRGEENYQFQVYA